MKYKIGDKVLAYAFDDFGYYRGDDYGNPVEVIILDINDKGIYLTKNNNGNWNTYREFELFETKEEIIEIIKNL